MVATCPYCGEKKDDLALRGHVMIQSDAEHAPLGQFPDDFERGLDIDDWQSLRGSVESEDEGEPSGLLAGLAERFG